MRNLILAAVLLVVLSARPAAAPGAAEAPAGSQSTAALSGYRAPVTGTVRVLRQFLPPPDRYGAGHLGVDLAAVPAGPVLAAGSGIVRFAGKVAGRGVLVLAHPDGISTEYEPVTATVVVGQQVRLGQPIGRLSGSHPGCPVAGCLHWGARRGENYLDPMSLLQPLGVVRLLPWNYPARVEPPSRPAGRQARGWA